MKFLPEWKTLLTGAWSFRLAILAGLFSAADMALPFFMDSFPPKVMALLSAIAAFGAAVARIIAQPRMRE